MRKLSDEHLKHLESHLPGRQILNLFKHVTQQYGVSPSTNQILDLIHELGKGYPAFLYYYHSYLNETNFYPIEFKKLEFPTDIERTLGFLEQNPLEESIFLHVKNSSLFEFNEFVAWVECTDLIKPDIGILYTIILAGEEGPIGINSFIEIRASAANPDPLFTILQNDEPKTGGLELLNDDPLLMISISILNYITKNQVATLSQPEKIIKPKKPSSNLNYPMDPKMIMKMVDLKKGQLDCYKATVSIDDITPFNYTFCYDFPIRYILKAYSEIDRILENGIVTYQKGNSLVMSDNYADYLALKMSDENQVTVVNIGELTIEHEMITKGDESLLPPVRLYANFESISQGLKNEILNVHIKRIRILREIEYNYWENKEQIKQKLATDIKSVLAELEIHVYKKELRDEIILINSRLNKLESDIRRGVISTENETLSFNKLRNDIIHLINEI